MLEIELWFWSLSQPASRRDALSRLLDNEETTRASRFVKPVDRDHFVVGRGRLREILGGYTGVAPEKIAFRYNEYGKPSLSAGGPNFNLSHSSGWAALVVGDRPGLGIDIEGIRPIEDSVARHYFSAAEYRDLTALPESLWLEGFYRCWTRKEAFVKACGEGLSRPLDSFDVTLTPFTAPRFTRIEGDDTGRWSLVHLETDLKILGSIAVRSDGETVRVIPKDAGIRIGGE